MEKIKTQHSNFRCCRESGKNERYFGHQESPDEPRIYIQLLHGRKYPSQVMDTFGFAGPCLGPFEWLHATYMTSFNLGAGKRIVWPLRDSLHGDLVFYDGNYYGDWEIVTENNLLNPPQSFDSSKAVPPESSGGSNGPVFPPGSGKNKKYTVELFYPMFRADEMELFSAHVEGRNPDEAIEEARRKASEFNEGKFAPEEFEEASVYYGHCVGPF